MHQAMPTALTARSISALKPKSKPFYVTDSVVRGLQLRVGTDGHKSWSLRYRFGRAMRRKTLGDLKTIDLAEARAMAKDDRKQVLKGIDPAEAKQARREQDTVASFAQVFIEQHAKRRKRWKGVKSRLDNDILPRWRYKLMRDVTRRDVRELLDEIAARPAPISANRVRALLSKFFNVAIQLDVVDANPVTGTARYGVEQRRDRVLTHDEIRKFWKACDALPLPMAAAWKLRLLTAQRANEVINMTWAELDLEGAWWTIPPERSKNGLAHRVPISKPVMTMLRALRSQADALIAAREAREDKRTFKRSAYVLAEARGARQQREAAATFGLENFKGHDLRRTAASLMTGSGTSRLVVAKILNHVERSVTSVYDRHSYDDEKRVALNAWARTLMAIIEKRNATVVAFKRR